LEKDNIKDRRHYEISTYVHSTWRLELNGGRMSTVVRTSIGSVCVCAGMNIAKPLSRQCHFFPSSVSPIFCTLFVPSTLFFPHFFNHMISVQNTQIGRDVCAVVVKPCLGRRVSFSTLVFPSFTG